jgi:hypothetical protein
MMSRMQSWADTPVAKIVLGVLIITVVLLIIHQTRSIWSGGAHAPSDPPTSHDQNDHRAPNDRRMPSPSACGMLSNGTYVPIENGCYARINDDVRPLTYTGGIISEKGERGRVVDEKSVLFDNGNVGTIVGGSVVDQNGTTSSIAYEAIAGADYLIVSSDQNPCVRVTGIQLTPHNGIVPNTDSSKCEKDVDTVPEVEHSNMPLVPSLSATLCADNSNSHPWCERIRGSK